MGEEGKSLWRKCTFEYLQKVWQNEGKGMNRNRMRKAWLQVMRSCGFPKASEKRGGHGGVRAMIAIIIIRLEKSKWIKWLRLLRQP